MDYRVYKWCSFDPTPPCDEMQDNAIIDGGRVTLQLTSAYSAGSAVIAEGAITSTTDPRFYRGQPVTARENNYVLVLSVVPGVGFCAADAPATVLATCGA